MLQHKYTMKHIIIKYHFQACDAPPSSLMDSLQVQRWKQWKDKELGAFPGSQHFKGFGVC
jgi:hypothetical protein